MIRFDFANPYLIYAVYVALYFLAVFFLFWKKDFVKRHAGKILLVFLLALLHTQTVRYILPLLDGRVNLPFFVCRLATLLLLLYLFFRIKRMHGILYFWCSTGMLAVLVPMGPPETIATLSETFIIDHFVIGLMPFFLLSVKEYRPSYKEATIYALILGVIFFLYIPFKDVYGWNYFFMHRGNFLLRFFPDLNWYVFAYLKTLVIWIYFLPYAIFGKMYLDRQKT